MYLQTFVSLSVGAVVPTTFLQGTSSLKALKKLAYGTGGLAQDAYMKLYSISQGGNTISPLVSTKHTSTSILLDPKGIIPSPCINNNLGGGTGSYLEDEETIIASSIIDFDCISFGKLPWAPEPFRRATKIYGFDEYGNKVDEQKPPTLAYGFAGNCDSELSIMKKLSIYKCRKKKESSCQNVQESKQEECISKTQLLTIERSKSVERPSRLDTPQVKELPIHQRKPSTSDGNNETMEEYIRNMTTYRTHWTRGDANKKIAMEPRIRRRENETGSYPNFSVEEEKLPTLLRYVWKGKLRKLKNYFADQRKHCKINRQDKHGRTALHFAASWACKRTMEVLLQVPGVNVDVKDGNDMTPLFKAVEIKSLDCVKLLIQSGANINITCRDGRNVLDYAIMEFGDECVDIITYLLSKVDISAKNNSKTKDDGRIMNALHKVCLTKKTVEVEKVIDLLVAHGVDINAVEGKGRTPLILATIMQRSDIITCLLRHFADLRRFDDDFKSALWYAKGTGCYELLSDVCRGNVRVLRHKRKNGFPKTTMMATSNSGKSTGTETAFGSCSNIAQSTPTSAKYKLLKY